MLPLESEIHRRIRAAGPMPVSEYMALCLTHPQYGYYSGSDPLGEAGDFTTSPEISQMFGELIGLWAATVWRAMGEPTAINLVELGPGRGTMMADIMRAVKLLPALRAGASASISSRRVRHCASGRSKSSPTYGRPSVLAFYAAGRSDRTGDLSRQRILRRAAGQSGGPAGRRLARTHGRNRRARDNSDSDWQQTRCRGSNRQFRGATRRADRVDFRMAFTSSRRIELGPPA